MVTAKARPLAWRKAGGCPGNKCTNGHRRLPKIPAGIPFLFLFSTSVALTSGEKVGPGTHDPGRLFFFLYSTFLFINSYVCVVLTAGWDIRGSFTKWILIHDSDSGDSPEESHVRCS